MLVLEVQDIHTHYGKTEILRGVSLRVERGSTVGILGRNGVGKSTLIRSLVGLTPPSEGKVLFKGVETTSLPAYSIARMGVGLVPQGKRIFPELSVRENLTIVAKRSGAGAGWNLERVFSVFTQLQSAASRKAKTLSGGEQQMLAIGRALMSNPELLLMDEPSEGLAPSLVNKVGSVIRQGREEGLTIVLVEQNVGFALSVVQHVCVMSRGKIVYEASPEEAWQNAEIKDRYLGI